MKRIGMLLVVTVGMGMGQMTPQAERGKALFLKSAKGTACGTCHSMGSVGTEVGPDLSKLASLVPPRGLVMAIEMTMTAYVQDVKTTKGSFPGIQKQKKGDELEIWDLSKLPPVLRKFGAGEVLAMKSNEKWVHPATAAHYSGQELADIVGFLKFASTGLAKEVTPEELGKK